MRKMLFSKRIIFVYTLIVIAPFFLFMTGITYSLLSKEDSRIRNGEAALLNDKCKIVEEAKNSFEMIETIILSDSELTLFLARPQSITEGELINTIVAKSNFMEQVSEITPDIYGIRIFANNENIPERWPVFLSSQRIENESKERWRYDYQATYLGNQTYMQLPSFCTTRPILKGNKEIGYLQIAYKMERAFPFLYDSGPDSEAYLIMKKFSDNQDFEIVKESTSYKNISLSEKQMKKLKKELNNPKSETGSLFIRKFDKDICWQYISDVDFYVVKITSFREVGHRFGIVIFLVFLGFVVTSFALFFVIRYATGKLMSGIYSVMEGMKEVKAGNYSVQIPVDGVDDVSETQAVFNSMTQQISSQIELIKVEQSLIADTEMKAMQNQINAHFLYNVLETIRMQAVLADEDEISDSLQILGRMMRYCLRWRVHRVSVAQEIEYIRSYIYILNVRNDYVISLEIDIPDECMEIEIPKMTLQPLIENAFVHAIEKEEKDATLRVFSEVNEDKSRITLSVQDFGCGMTEEQVETLNNYLKNDTYEKEANKGSIGLKNIQQRLTVFYGADFRINIESKVGEGTTISVPVPFKKLTQSSEK